MAIPGGYLVTSESFMTNITDITAAPAHHETHSDAGANSGAVGKRYPLGTGKRPCRGDRGGVGALFLSGGRTRTPGCLVGFRAIDLGAPHTMVTSEKKVKLRVFRPIVGRRVDVGTSGSSPWPRRRMYHSHRVCSTRIFNAGTSRVEVPCTT